MIVSTVTDRDEWNYLDTLEDSDVIGYAHSADYGYLACVLRSKYPQCQTVKLTTTTFQVLQFGISAVSVPLTLAQCARQELLDALDASLEGNITKKDWLQILSDEDLLPQP